jgi:hypothetical protein
MSTLHLYLLVSVVVSIISLSIDPHLGHLAIYNFLQNGDSVLNVIISLPSFWLLEPGWFVYHFCIYKRRYNDGFSNGGQAAATDKQQGNAYNPVCDPTGQYTSDGQHSTTYCTGWANGYSATWNSNNYNYNPPQQQQTGCPDGSQPDSNGNCPSSSQPIQNHQSLVDRLCHAVNTHSGEITAVTTLAPILHIATGGLTVLVPIVQAYCAVHGG